MKSRCRGRMTRLACAALPMASESRTRMGETITANKLQCPAAQPRPPLPVQAAGDEETRPRQLGWKQKVQSRHVSPCATLPAPAQTKEKTADPNKHQEQYGLV